MADKHHENGNPASKLSSNRPKNMAFLTVHTRCDGVQFFQGQLSALDKEPFIVVLHHSDDVESASHHFADERRVRKPAVHQDVSCSSGFQGAIQHRCNHLRSRLEGFLTAFVARRALVDLLVHSVDLCVA